MTTNLDIVREARSYIGSPYHHQGRSKQFGVDCLGVVVGISKTFELFDHDFPGYSHYMNDTLLESELGKCLTRIDLDVCQPGDVVTFWISKPGVARHVGILSPAGIVHTYANIKRVTEHRLGDSWLKRINGVFRFPNIEVVTKEVAGWLR
jgi:NlpC/P60 family putative phage cell wall peptidase